MNTDPIYEADGKISVRKAVPFGLQHVLAMFVANIAPILIVTGVVKIPASEAGAVVQAAMIIAGIGSLLQMYPVFRLGSGLPVIMGISFTFVSVFCVIGLKYGYGAILGAVLVGGVLEGILGLGAAWWRKLVPPIVSIFSQIGQGSLPWPWSWDSSFAMKKKDRAKVRTKAALMKSAVSFLRYAMIPPF